MKTETQAAELQDKLQAATADFMDHLEMHHDAAEMMELGKADIRRIMNHTTPALRFEFVFTATAQLMQRLEYWYPGQSV